jgi:pilus assembly protein CpaF
MAGMEGEVVSMQDIFKFEVQHTDKDGKIHGAFLPTGLRSIHTERFAQWGYNLPTSIYTRAAQ